MWHLLTLEIQLGKIQDHIILHGMLFMLPLDLVENTTVPPGAGEFDARSEIARCVILVGRFETIMD
jgi:hypothetical protein